MTADAHTILADAIASLEANNPHSSDGKWLETLTAAVAPHLREWDIAACWPWAEWPERETRFPQSGQQDVGIDVVAVRRGDGGHIAIQCKARRLDDAGRGGDISKGEVNSFIGASVNELWTERWLVTNGDNQITGNAGQVLTMADPERPVKLINIHAAIAAQQQAAPPPEPCPHCQPADDADADGDSDAAPAFRRQTKQCMQDEAVAQSVRILRQHAAADSGGLPKGQARGKLILPCGAGKTRISLRIIEQLTPPGDVAIVLCPSIALVAQIRREYLQHAKAPLRALAVCSDVTAGYDPRKESSRNTAADPTLDNSNVSAAEVKGMVTTDPAKIARWLQDPAGAGQISVIFGTYQSGRRIADALQATGSTAQVLVADEAHRTAGLRRSNKPADNEKRRDFTLCHDHAAFPAVYRLYQTATPRIYDTRKLPQDRPADWIVRSMDDETVFGVELYRKSYVEAVNNQWLADYRIIAVAVNGPDEHQLANQLAGATASKGKQSLTTTHFLRGLAFTLAMGGAARGGDGRESLPIKSCIAFMNTVDKSKNMAYDLHHTAAVREWLQTRMSNDGQGPAAAYVLEHLDATSNVTARENAKLMLAQAGAAAPHGIINVGIFGEGTDAPSLSAVAFLEARKSPIDVIQAVGRAMRTAPGKQYGYIICPIVIPPSADPESWLKTSGPEDGWQELAQILLALRAHDSRIEDELAELMHLYLPPAPEQETSIVAAPVGAEQRIAHGRHTGPPGAAAQAVARVVSGASDFAAEFRPLTEPAAAPDAPAAPYRPETGETRQIGDEKPAAAAAAPPPEPTQIITGKKNRDGSIELRQDAVAREKPGADGAPGPVDYPKSKAKSQRMINHGDGVRIPADPPRPRRTREEVAEQSMMRLFQLTGMADAGNAITMNLLAKSGLTDNRIQRDANMLEDSIREAAHHLRNDELQPALDTHFGLDNLKDDTARKQADGCTIAALLMMNAAMLHQRIANGRWLSGISDLAAVKNDVQAVYRTRQEWERIMRHDFRPVLEPAVEAIYAIERTGRLAGLERALRHIAAEAGRLAETYADLGADHAGPLFNRVMGNQASDGAFFTRPAAASIAARLTLDAAGDADWTDPEVWRAHKTVDLACGSGTLLAAILTDLKRRAAAAGANDARLAQLQEIAVEETLKGMDINPVSLQLAAAQLTAGNQDIRYRRMGLYQMPYGPQPGAPGQISAGTLELLGQQTIVPRRGAMDMGDDKIASQTVWHQSDNPELRDPVEAAKDARIVIMNPPFTNRAKMGEKFIPATKQALRQRADEMESVLVRNDPALEKFVDKNALEPLFTALADKCLANADGVFTMINSTVALGASSAQEKRRILAQRYHIHTVLTCHQPGNVNLSQGTGINESIVVAQRYDGPKPPTRFINLDRLPGDDAEVADLHQGINDCAQGNIANGWGEVSYWPAERIAAGDWTPAIWRSPELAEAAARFANDDSLVPLPHAWQVGRELTQNFKRGEIIPSVSFPVIDSGGADGQQQIQGKPDSYWVPKMPDDSIRLANGGTFPAMTNLFNKKSHLLVTFKQNTSTARLTAVAGSEQYVGNAWMTISDVSETEAKALAVFLNSTPGRLQIMRNPGQSLGYPQYPPAIYATIRVPDIKDARVRDPLAACWESTRGELVPQFRDGECPVRRRWDEAVAAVTGWPASELSRLRHLLHREPHVRGLGYHQHAVAPEG